MWRSETLRKFDFEQEVNMPLVKSVTQQLFVWMPNWACIFRWPQDVTVSSFSCSQEDCPEQASVYATLNRRPSKLFICRCFTEWGTLEPSLNWTGDVAQSHRPQTDTVNLATQLLEYYFLLEQSWGYGDKTCWTLVPFLLVLFNLKFLRRSATTERIPFKKAFLDSKSKIYEEKTQLRALTDLPKDPSSIPSTYVLTYNHM